MSNIGGKILDGLLESLVEEETRKRIYACKLVLRKYHRAKEALANIVPEHTKFDAVGEPIGAATFTKKQVEEIIRLNGVIARLDQALIDGLVHSNFEDVFKEQHSKLDILLAGKRKTREEDEDDDID